MPRPAIERFEEKFKKSDGCWEWTSSLNNNGYGQFHYRKKNVYSHRFSYELYVGPIPNGMVLDHLCRNTKCLNPKHLEVVTQAVNMARGKMFKYRSEKTECPSGHTYDAANTRMYEGRRYCRACHRVRSKIRKAKLRLLRDKPENLYRCEDVK